MPAGAQRPTQRPWYLDAIVYAIEVPAFYDSNGDGVGDLRGVIAKLDYLAGLGVDCLWILPTYVSSDRDNGYDVVDHRRVEEVYGGDAAMDELIAAVRERGMHLMLDLVANHTSDQHPWFIAARRSRRAPERSRYVWELDPPDKSAEPIFPGVEQSVWQYDEKTDAHYRHRFYAFEPDLNTHSDAVQDEAEAVLRFWAERGVDAIRVDAASHLVERKGRQQPPDPFRPLRRLDALGHELDVPLVGEADVPPERYTEYLGDDAGLDMIFNFYLCEALFLALATQSAEPVDRALERIAHPPPGRTYLNFLRNLDELDLEQLRDDEQQQVFDAFAPDDEMRVYGRGIRRRLAPMLGGDGRRMRLAWSLLFAMPGIPLIVYGDEIGLGEDLELPERWSVRTTMQWSSEPHGGFSKAPDELVLRSPLPDGQFGYRAVNVGDQAANSDSLLCWFGELVRARRSVSVLCDGRWQSFGTGNGAVSGVIHRPREGSGELAVVLHNLSADGQRASLPDDLPAADLRTIFADDGSADSEAQAAFAPGDELELAGFGFRWLKGLVGDEQAHADDGEVAH